MARKRPRLLADPSAGGNLELPMSGALQQLLWTPNDKGVWACGFCC
jgi:hypothetical protein